MMVLEKKVIDFQGERIKLSDFNGRLGMITGKFQLIQVVIWKNCCADVNKVVRKPSAGATIFFSFISSCSEGCSFGVAITFLKSKE